jgi:hypothetical protein
LFRHYWVVIKLVMNLFASTILLLYMQTLTALADAARAAGGGDASTMADPSPAVHSGAAIALLTVAAVLSVYKPAGQTAYGMRHNRISSTAAKAGAAP